MHKQGHVQAPKFIKDISWALQHWPEKYKDGQSTWDTKDERPCYHHYVLFGTKGSYTEWHIDFGGTSVWYHIHRGKKVFLLVAPTKKNLKLFEGKIEHH